MPRTIVSGNGSLLVAVDKNNMLQDFYFPHVGMENQIAYQHFHRIGIFTDNQFTWMYDENWAHESKYIPETLVTDCASYNPKLKLRIDFNDFVYPSENAFIRKISITNDADYDRLVKIFFAQDFHLYGDKQQDTAFYEPEHKALIHYRKSRYCWISGSTGGKEGIHSFTTGKSEYQGMEGTWKDAEDGRLLENPIEQGSIDSTVEFDLTVKAKETAILYVWICAGKNLQEVRSIHKFILDETPEKLLKNAINYWISWVNKDRQDINVDSEVLRQYKQSLLIIRTQIDNDGGIIAANDSDIMKFNKDTYSYVWPRDGAWVAMALDKAGYGEITKRFFEFCGQAIEKDGYLLHKYNPDKSVGSSWHAWFKDGEIQMPIQEDETAIVLYALWNHYKSFRDIEFVQKMYSSFIKKAANFLANFIDEETDLPLQSYDLWERERGVFSYTCACTYAGLLSAANLCAIIGHFNHHRRYEKCAERIKNAVLKHLYDKESGRFLKRVTINRNSGEIKKDYTIDASIHGIWLFGLLPPNDPRVIKTNEDIYNTLVVKTKFGGLARFEQDDYQRVPGDYTGIPGNPWIITTLWHAQWLMAKAKNKNDLKEVENYINWTLSHMNEAGLLPEQISPFTGEHLSVAPLTWSHAVFVDTVLKYNDKLKELS